MVSGKGLVLYCSELRQAFPLKNIKLLPPCRPTKIIGIGLNYKDTSSKFPDEPSYFFKPVSSLIGPDDPIRLPEGSKDVAFEPELAIVVGKKACKVSLAEASEYIAGYTCANDVTAVDFLDPNFNKGKSFDTFTPVGPWIVKDFKPEGKGINGFWNGRAVISSNLDNLFFSPKYLLSFLSNIMTLEAGDLILTGASKRYSPIGEGDNVTIKIDGIGELNNIVTSSK